MFLGICIQYIQVHEPLFEGGASNTVQFEAVWGLYRMETEGRRVKYFLSEREVGRKREYGQTHIVDGGSVTENRFSLPGKTH